MELSPLLLKPLLAFVPVPDVDGDDERGTVGGMLGGETELLGENLLYGRNFPFMFKIQSTVEVIVVYGRVRVL
jgi:hypothetical protein